MATRWWVGSANDGDWSNTNNWASSRFGAGGAGVPASTDSVYVWDTAQTIAAGLAQSAVDLALLDIRFAGNIGTGSTALAIAVSSGGTPVLRYAGSGQYCNISAGTNGIDQIQVLRTDGVFRLAGGTTLALECGLNGRGRVEVEAGAVLQDSVLTCGLPVTLKANATGVLNGYFYGPCKVNSERTVAEFEVGAGATFRHERATAPTTAKIEGRYEHMSSGTITNIWTYPGGVATSNGNAATFTVTTAYKYEGSSLFEQEPNVTFSNTPTVYGETR